VGLADPEKTLKRHTPKLQTLRRQTLTMQTLKLQTLKMQTLKSVIELPLLWRTVLDKLPASRADHSRVRLNLSTREKLVDPTESRHAGQEVQGYLAH